jgi:hypothetical protein
MRLTRTSGSVGGLGGRPPRSTRLTISRSGLGNMGSLPDRPRGIRIIKAALGRLPSRRRVRHASHRTIMPRRLHLPRPQPRQRPRHRVPQARRLRRLRPHDGRGRRPHIHEHPGLLPDAQPLPPGPLAPRGRRSEPLGALADDHPRPPLPAVLSLRRPRMARSVQGVLDPGR